MSFKSKLKVGGKELNILNASYDLHQEVDASGRPSSVTRGGTIYLTVFRKKRWFYSVCKT